MPKKGANLGAYSVDDMMCGVMLSNGARLGDHSDDMSRSTMGSQLERGNSSSTREVRRTGALAASTA
jgi:hypothetical protein